MGKRGSIEIKINDRKKKRQRGFVDDNDNFTIKVLAFYIIVSLCEYKIAFKYFY